MRLKDHLEEELQSAEFRREFEKLQPQYQIISQVIAGRMS